MNNLEVYDMAIGIERMLFNLYYRFSNLFKENREAHNFWTCVANHEKSHSETLTLSKGYLLCNHPSLTHKNISLFHESEMTELESLNLLIKEYERRLKKKTLSLQEAFDVLLKIENSEINHLYNRLIHASGFKFLQKPENAHRTIDEHLKVIRTFMEKHYRGNTPISVKDYRDAGTVGPIPSGEVIGKIVDVIQEMSYGFIEGKDGVRYMFLLEDIVKGDWEDVGVNKSVEFSVIRLPWGPRAKDIKVIS